MVNVNGNSDQQIDDIITHISSVSQRISHIRESVGSLKEVKINGMSIGLGMLYSLKNFCKEEFNKLQWRSLNLSSTIA